MATILLLSLTVVLFAALFAFVTRFPAPPAQSTDQFQASLSTAANGTITGISIVHLAGPSVSLSAKVYLQSSVVGLPNRQFSTSGIPLAWGLGNTTLPWNLGQVWKTTFGTNSTNPVVPSNANITVFIVAGNQLVFSVILGTSSAAFAPTILTTGTLPTPVGVGKSFVAFATLGGNFAEFNASNPVKVNLGAIPGLPTVNETMNSSSAGYWSTTIAGGRTTTTGTYYAFISGTSPVGSISGEITVNITAKGGGGSGGAFTVLSGVSPSPPVPVVTPPPNIYLTATINYTGSSANVAVGVNFTVHQMEGGRTKAGGVWSNSSVLAGQAGDKISGPGTLVVYSQSPYPAWLLNSTATITATVNLSGVGTVVGSTVLVTPNFVPGVVYVTTSSAGALGSKIATMSHSCTVGTNCPYLYVQVWDNFTSSFGGPASVSVNGTVWSNISLCASGCAASTLTIGATTVNAASSTAINAAGGATQWKPAGAAPPAGAKYKLSVLLTVKEGATIIGYVYSTTLITLT